MNVVEVTKNEPDKGKCPKCSHDLKYHDQCGCWGAFPNGTDGFGPDELFYGECHCSHRPKKI